VSISGNGTHDKKARRSGLRWIPLVLGLLVILLVADAIWSGLTATRDLCGARDQLTHGGELLVAGDLTGAQAAFSQASSMARGAGNDWNHPAPRLAETLPWVGDDAHAVDALAQAAVDAADAGLELTAAARRVGWDGAQLPGFGAGGKIDAARIQAGAPGVRAAADLLVAAQRRLEDVETADLVAPVASAVDQARTSISERASTAGKAAAAAELLPGFLGADGPRTYLIVMQNLSDPRGAGGYPGSFGLIHTDGHRIRLEELQPTSTIPVVAPVAAPPDVVRLYGSFGATTHFIATTYSPDFPTDARLMLGIWEAAGRPPVDGVISGDAVFMSYLLQALGPVDSPVVAPGWPASITSDNVVEVMNRDTFMTTSQTQSDQWQTAIGTALWGSLLSRPWPPQALATALARGVDERHLQVYATDRTQQQALTDLGATGAVRFSTGQPSLVVLQGLSDNRAGYFVTTKTTSSTRDLPDGGTEVTVTVTLHNSAPTGPPSILLGTPTFGSTKGSFQTQLQVYLPTGAKVVKSTVDGKAGFLDLVEEEFGRPMAVQLLEMPAGGTTSATIVYRLQP
jgi:hypothetical protein